MKALLSSHRRLLGGGLCLLALFLCRGATARSQDNRFLEIEAWTGSYRASGRAENSRPLPMVDTLKEAQSVSAQVVLDRKEVSRSRVTWEGTATCNASGSFYAKGSTPGTPLWQEESGSDSRIFTTPAKLVVHPSRGTYTISLCREAYSYGTVSTGTGINELGKIVPVSGEGSHTLNPGIFYSSKLMPGGPLPREGFHLTGSLDIGAGPGGEFGKAMDLAAMTGIKVDGKVQWSFSPDLCSDNDYQVQIKTPPEPVELIFKEGELSGSFLAVPVPDTMDLRSRILWQPFELEGSSLAADPENRTSDYITLTYKELPPSNDAFGEKEISATLGALERCTESGKRKATVFFDPEGNNGSGEPNWMWYWMQTSAGKKFAGLVKEGDPEKCEKQDILGYFSGSDSDSLYVCHTVLAGRSSDPFGLVEEKKLRSIDVFAMTVIHENQHRQNHHDWWSDIPRNQWPAEKDWNMADYDHDLVPDEVEVELGYNPLNRDTFDIGYRDVEVSAYQTLDQWVVGSAHDEDWACPGSQGQDVCREEPR